jgi:hypothetical protein
MKASYAAGLHIEMEGEGACLNCGQIADVNDIYYK